MPQNSVILVVGDEDRHRQILLETAADLQAQESMASPASTPSDLRVSADKDSASPNADEAPSTPLSPVYSGEDPQSQREEVEATPVTNTGNEDVTTEGSETTVKEDEVTNTDQGVTPVSHVDVEETSSIVGSITRDDIGATESLDLNSTEVTAIESGHSSSVDLTNDSIIDKGSSENDTELIAGVGVESTTEAEAENSTTGASTTSRSTTSTTEVTIGVVNLNDTSLLDAFQGSVTESSAPSGEGEGAGGGFTKVSGPVRLVNEEDVLIEGIPHSLPPGKDRHTVLQGDSIISSVLDIINATSHNEEKPKGFFSFSPTLSAILNHARIRKPSNGR